MRKISSFIKEHPIDKEKILYGIIGLLAVLLIVLVVDRYGNYSKKADAETLDEESIAFKSLATPVEILVLQKRNLIQTISTNGTVKAQRMSELIPQMSGLIQELNFEEGDRVGRGDVILRIDDDAYKIEYEKAKERVNKALAEYGIMIMGEAQSQSIRQDTTRSQESVFNTPGDNVNDHEAFEFLRGNHRKEMLASKAGLTAARLDLQKAELDLKNTVLTAPFDGYIAELELFKDGRIEAGKKAMKIVSLDPLFIDVGILETEILFIKAGSGVLIEIPALPGKSFQGNIKTISPILDYKSGTCRIQIEIRNRDRDIKPGMFANARINTKEYAKRLLIPRGALLIRDERKVTFVYEKGLAKWRYVQTGLENDESIEVTDGLSEGDSLITSGHFNLAHDALVVIVQKEKNN